MSALLLDCCQSIGSGFPASPTCAASRRDGTTPADCQFALHCPGVVCRSSLRHSTSAHSFALRIQAPELALSMSHREPLRGEWSCRAQSLNTRRRVLIRKFSSPNIARSRRVYLEPEARKTVNCMISEINCQTLLKLSPHNASFRRASQPQRHDFGLPQAPTVSSWETNSEAECSGSGAMHWRLAEPGSVAKPAWP